MQFERREVDDRSKDCNDNRGGVRVYGTMRNLVEWGKLPVLKVGRKVLIKSDILEKFMEVNEGKNLRDKSDVKTVTRKSAV